MRNIFILIFGCIFTVFGIGTWLSEAPNDRPISPPQTERAQKTPKTVASPSHAVTAIPTHQTTADGFAGWHQSGQNMETPWHRSLEMLERGDAQALYQTLGTPGALQACGNCLAILADAVRDPMLGKDLRLVIADILAIDGSRLATRALLEAVTEAMDSQSTEHGEALAQVLRNVNTPEAAELLASLLIGSPDPDIAPSVRAWSEDMEQFIATVIGGMDGESIASTLYGQYERGGHSERAFLESTRHPELLGLLAGNAHSAGESERVTAYLEYIGELSGQARMRGLVEFARHADYPEQMIDDVEATLMTDDFEVDSLLSAMQMDDPDLSEGELTLVDWIMGIAAFKVQ